MDAAPSPSAKPATQKVAPRKTEPKAQARLTERKRGSARKVRVAVLGVAGLVAALSAGAYIFVVAPLVHSQGVEPKVALSALEKLQHLPSNDPKLTVDESLLNELEKSRRVGNLVGYKGWTVHSIKGTKTRVLLVFSFREVGNTEQRAEWLADLDANKFTPQTPLAASVLR
jgi:hypothetical protein